MDATPLVVDLDGTLINTDTLHEATLRVLRDAPLDAMKIPFWLSQGKAQLKRALADRVSFDPTNLPYNQGFIQWLRAQRAAGRKLVLCTASDHSFAQSIADHLNLFDEVLASDGNHNMAGHNKAQALQQRFGSKGFDYAGNSSADLKVWKYARRAIVVNASTNVCKQAQTLAQVEQEFPAPPLGVRSWLKALRVHQWMKNLLLFVALLAAHHWEDTNAWQALILAFVSFSLCASSVYIANDLFDLESDRQHPRKRYRAFASGLIPVWMGVALAPVLLLASVALAWQVGSQFLFWLLFYFVLTCAYSWGLKRLVLIDCLALAILYTLRIVAGAAAADLELSMWLLAFSVFLFLSLAFVKRYAELLVQTQHGNHKAHGRGYYISDAPLIQMLGITSGYASVVVLALYLNSVAVIQLYHNPEIVWGAVPAMLFWISWMWLRAHRGEMHDDPLVFALKDKPSLAAGVVFALALGLASVEWS